MVEGPHVSVFGTAVTEVQPDLIRWRISIRCTGTDAEATAAEHANDVAATLEFIKQEGIPPAKIQTARMQLSEIRKYREGISVTEKYGASTEILFISNDLSTYRGLWLGISKLKGATIDYATLDSSKRMEVQKTTRLDALKSAKEKATAMVDVLGVNLGEPLAIEELAIDYINSNYAVTTNSVQQAPREDSIADGSLVAPGSVLIRARVQVAFRIATK